MTGPGSLYGGSYPARRAGLMRTITPSSKCWRCGRTLAEHEPHHTGKPVVWNAGHLVAGDPRSPLALEASTCNRRWAGRKGASRRWGAGERQSPNA